MKSSKSKWKYPWERRVVRQASLGVNPFYRAYVPRQIVTRASLAELGYECVPEVKYLVEENHAVRLGYPSCYTAIAVGIAEEYGLETVTSDECGLGVSLSEDEFNRLMGSLMSIKRFLFAKGIASLASVESLWEFGLELRHYNITRYDGAYNRDFMDVIWHGKHIDLCLAYHFDTWHSKPAYNDSVLVKLQRGEHIMQRWCI